MISSMSRQLLGSLMILSCATGIAAEAPTQDRFEFLGEALISGADRDLSGQERLLVNGEPANRFGGISALEYTGQGNRYLALSDRGPDDGATEYECRLHVLDLTWSGENGAGFQAELQETLLLRDQQGRCFSGSSKVLQPGDQTAGRLDPEGIRIGANGSIFISDEYGPQLIEFSGRGEELRRFALPTHLQVSKSMADKNEEIAANTTGRFPNRGMEGLALSSDGTKLIGIMQSCLLQDGKANERGWIIGMSSRIIEVTIATGEIREFVYPMESAANGISEILACGPEQYLVLERDGEAGLAATSKKVFRIDLSGATDVVGLDSLPADRLPEGVTAVSKHSFLDLLSKQFPFAGETLPEKMEGLTFGPLLPDGRRSLVIAIDNDFESDFPTRFWLFAMNDARQLSQR